VTKWRVSVLECGSPLPLFTEMLATQSGRGLPHSKTSRKFLIATRDSATA